MWKDNYHCQMFNICDIQSFGIPDFLEIQNSKMSEISGNAEIPEVQNS